MKDPLDSEVMTALLGWFLVFLMSSVCIGVIFLLVALGFEVFS